MAVRFIEGGFDLLSSRANTASITEVGRSHWIACEGILASLGGEKIK